MFKIQSFIGLFLLSATLVDIVIGYTGPAIEYPIKLAYVNRVADWSNPQGLARSIGVPGYSNHSYNYIVLTFWTCTS